MALNGRPPVPLRGVPILPFSRGTALESLGKGAATKIPTPWRGDKERQWL